MNIASSCPCCTSPVLLGVLLFAWTVFVSTSMVIGKFSKKGSRVQSILKVFSWLLTGAIVLFAIALAILQLSPSSRAFVFAKMCAGMGKEPEMVAFRCGHVGQHKVHGRVLEIGPGPGANFKCWNDNDNIIEWVGVEPNNYFEPFISENKKNSNVTFPTKLVWMDGENVAVEPNSFDFVVATHVLCSVTDVDQVLRQISRALKPGGKYYFIEHVTSREENSAMWWLQRIAAPVFHIVGNGCTFRHLGDNINALKSQFDISMEYIQAPVSLPIIRPHIYGVATKKIL